MRITKKQLRRIIRESMATHHSRRSIPRSVQADYDLANKEDTFPKAQDPKQKPDMKASYETVNKEMTKALQGLPGYQSILSGEGAYVDLSRKEVVDILKPVAAKIGAEVKDGKADETFIRHPSGVMVLVFGSGTGTEVDFGPTPGV